MYSPDSRGADPLAGRSRDDGMTVTAASNPPVPSSSRMDALIRLEEVTKRYDGDAAPAVHGVGMQIAPGESVAVMGPSGSGKSTLLNMIAGLDRPTSGTVTVAGERIDRLSETGLARFRRRQVGMIFQFFNLLDDMTVLDNVLLPDGPITATDSPGAICMPTPCTAGAASPSYRLVTSSSPIRESMCGMLGTAGILAAATGMSRSPGRLVGGSVPRLLGEYIAVRPFLSARQVRAVAEGG